jgi:hypothetical protein
MFIMYHETTRAPMHVMRLLRDDIIVRRYTTPERVGSIFLPASDHRYKHYAYDKTQTLWEVLVSNAKADEAVGLPLSVGCIVQTLRRWPRDLHAVDASGEHCFLLSPSTCGIRGVIAYADETQEP